MGLDFCLEAALGLMKALVAAVAVVKRRVPRARRLIFTYAYGYHLP